MSNLQAAGRAQGAGNRRDRHLQLKYSLARRHSVHAAERAAEASQPLARMMGTQDSTLTRPGTRKYVCISVNAPRKRPWALANS